MPEPDSPFGPFVPRATLLARLNALWPTLPGLHAAWLEGADALGRADEFSDLDLWLDVDAPQIEAALAAVRAALATSFGPLDVDDRRAHPDPRIQQRFYRAGSLSPYLFVDVCVQAHGRSTVFGPADAWLPLYDPGGLLRRAEGRGERLPDASRPDAQARAGELLGQQWRFMLVEKELRRDHPLEALAYYHAEVLSRLLETLRLRYAPHKADFGLKHVHADLPADVVARLLDLYRRTQPEELRAGVDDAGRWMTHLWLEWPSDT